MRHSRSNDYYAMNTLRMSVAALIALAIIVPAASFANNDKSAGIFLRTETLVQIREDGSTLVRGAEVTAVSDSSITAETEHDGVTLSWTVRTDGGTEFVTYNGGGFDLDDLDRGDTVSFSGELTSAFTIDADVVKDWTLPDEARAAFSGTVERIDDDDHSFVLSGTRLGDLTVETDGNTTFTGGDDFGDLSVGDHVSVSGTYSADDDTLEATKVAIGQKPVRFDFGTKVKAWFGNHFGFWKK